MSDSYHAQIAKLIGYMAAKPMSRQELRVFTGLTQSTVDKWLSAFRAAKLIYIADYDLDQMGRLRIPCYLFDPGKSDVPRSVIAKRKANQ